MPEYGAVFFISVRRDPNENMAARSLDVAEVAELELVADALERHELDDVLGNDAVKKILFEEYIPHMRILDLYPDHVMHTSLGLLIYLRSGKSFGSFPDA